MLAGKAAISAARRGLGELVIAAVPVLAIAPLAFPTVAPAVIAWAIAVSAAALRWVIAGALAAVPEATAGGVLVPAAVVAHPAWEASAGVEADLVAAAVCAAAAAAVAGAGGKHHEN